MKNEGYRVTEHGVIWGEAELEFVMSDPKFGSCLEIRTGTERLQIRVTPSGKFRIGFDKKPLKESWVNCFEANDKPVPR